MTDAEGFDGFRGLYKDLLASFELRLPNVEKLWAELEVRVEDFKKLLDKKTKDDRSRQAISSGNNRMQTQVRVSLKGIQANCWLNRRQNLY